MENPIFQWMIGGKPTIFGNIHIYIQTVVWPWVFWTINSINMFTNFQNQNTPSGLCLLWKSLPLLNFQLDDPPWRYANLTLDWPRLQWIQISHSLFLATRYAEGDELPSTFKVSTWQNSAKNSRSFYFWMNTTWDNHAYSRALAKRSWLFDSMP